MQYARTTRTVLAVLLSGVFSVTALPVSAQTAPDKTKAAPDNTKVNERDRAQGAVTADQQKENASDRDVVKRIRESLVKDKSLSTYAHNVKVVAQDGQVTIKGPVRSEEEKRSVEAKAIAVAGAGRVTNEITVAPPTKSKS